MLWGLWCWYLFWLVSFDRFVGVSVVLWVWLLVVLLSVGLVVLMVGTVLWWEFWLCFVLFMFAVWLFGCLYCFLIGWCAACTLLIVLLYLAFFDMPNYGRFGWMFNLCFGFVLWFLCWFVVLVVVVVFLVVYWFGCFSCCGWIILPVLLQWLLCDCCLLFVYLMFSLLAVVLINSVGRFVRFAYLPDYLSRLCVYFGVVCGLVLFLFCCVCMFVFKCVLIVAKRGWVTLCGDC